MSTHRENPAGELDVILSDAAGELLEHLRSADPDAVLLKLMTVNAAPPTEIAAPYPRVQPVTGADTAASIIAMRAGVRDLLGDLDLVCSLDRACDHDRTAGRARDPVRDLVHDDLRDGALERADNLVHGLDLAGACDGVLERADDLIRALDLDRTLNVAVVQAGDLVRGLSIVHSLHLDRVPDRVRVLDRIRSRDRLRVLVHALDLARDLDRALDYADDLARALDRARDLGRALDHAYDLDRGWGLDRALGHAYHLERDLIRARAGDLIRARARDLIHGLIRDLDTIEVDVSGVDLHRLDLRDLDVVAGVLWTPDTVWPRDIARQVQARSREIRPGMFQVGGPGTEHNLTEQPAPAR